MFTMNVRNEQDVKRDRKRRDTTFAIIITGTDDRELADRYLRQRWVLNGSLLLYCCAEGENKIKYAGNMASHAAEEAGLQVRSLEPTLDRFLSFLI
jgi:hypothetical protein